MNCFTGLPATLPFLLALCAALLCSLARAEAISDDLSTGVNGYTDQLHSGKFLLKSERCFVVDHSTGEKAGTTETAEEELVFDGVRSRYQRTFHRPNPRPGLPSLESVLLVFDGEKVTRIESPENGVTPGTQTFLPRNLPEELPTLVGGPSGLLGRVLGPQLTQIPPLGTELRSTYRAQEAGDEVIAGLHCVRLVGPTEDHGTFQLTRSWWVAPEKGYALAQYAEDAAWTPPVKSVSRRQVCTVGKWMQVDGIWLPEECVLSTFGQPAGGTEQLYRTEKTTIVTAAVNTPIGDDVFALPKP